MTRAVTLASLADQNIFTADSANDRVGIGSTAPTSKLDVNGDVNVSGTLTATAFVGDGTGLTGVASTDNIITGTAATFTGGVTIGGDGNINLTGVITATKFVGDGSELTGVSGFATALSSDTTSILNRFFKTPEEIAIGAGTSISITSDDASGNVAFCREGKIHVAVGATFHVGSGTTLATNVLGVFS